MRDTKYRVAEIAACIYNEMQTNIYSAMQGFA
jgi:hypothetical protein